MRQGAISVGDLTGMLFYAVDIGSSVQMLTSFFVRSPSPPPPHSSHSPPDPAQTSIMHGIGARARIFELLERTPVIPPTGLAVLAPPPGTPIQLAFEGVGGE